MNRDAFEKGLKTRREVLGAEYVDQAIRNADDFNLPLQELVTEYCWNEIWNRPGLDRKTRSIVNLAMLTALNRPHELKLHVKGAKEIEAQELATKECKKNGKSVARISEARSTHNDNFPMIYIYQCLN